MPGGGGAGHQLGHDRPDPPQVPRGQRAGGREPLVFKALASLFANYLCLAFMVLVLAVLVYIGEGISVLLAPCG